MSEPVEIIQAYPNPFRRHEPLTDSNVIPLLVTSPHSGVYYPQSFVDASRLDAHALRQSEDMYVEALFASAVEHGAQMICAHYPRAFVDLNRAENEIDPILLDQTIPAHQDHNSPRVKAGLGTIPRIVAEDTPIYNGPISADEVQLRLRDIYQPFHQQLASTLDQYRADHGRAVLIDAHSMPSQAVQYKDRSPNRSRKFYDSEAQAGSIDIVLGDRNGKSCAPGLTETVRDHFKQSGLHVTLNKPYAGGFITQQYGRPESNQHALQIEINRALYMNEVSYEKTANFYDLQNLIDSLLGSLADHMAHNEFPISRMPKAAE